MRRLWCFLGSLADLFFEAVNAAVRLHRCTKVLWAVAAGSLMNCVFSSGKEARRITFS